MHTVTQICIIYYKLSLTFVTFTMFPAAMAGVNRRLLSAAATRVLGVLAAAGPATANAAASRASAAVGVSVAPVPASTAAAGATAAAEGAAPEGALLRPLLLRPQQWVPPLLLRLLPRVPRIL